ncbi:MAG: undecaprenyl-diphosphate phosphatase [Gammaproteobacteria bacterium]|nr:undecaprenyl-diphosphate phosphatase [Gammaproteobacteria bacterium]MDH5691933.1 undecaprenyl-diphosphate phosphatase [Gammaproteobacteria bacterium]
MDFLHIVVLALVQGITEFLPISSSAHLILVPEILHWPDQGLAFDVAVHLGTLSAVMLYFRAQIVHIVADTSKSILAKQTVGESNLGWGIVLATLPAVVFGFTFKDYVETDLRGPLIIASTTIGFGLLLWYADIKQSEHRTLKQINWRDVIIIGLAQAVAIIPGTSRSGITITAALLLGLNRDAAARFSFLLSIPTIAGAGVLLTKDLLEQNAPVDWSALLIGTLVSAVSAYLCIHYFLKLISRMGMKPFVIYRLLLGIILLILFV